MAYNIQQTSPFEDVRQAVLQLLQGRGNYIGDVTLAAGQVSTVVNFENCSQDCRVFLQAQSVAATTLIARVAAADIHQGTFTIRHTAAPAAAIFSFACLGG